MFSVKQKRMIATKVQTLLRATRHPELPDKEIDFTLVVRGEEPWLWARIQNNGAVPEPSVNPHNEEQDTGASSGSETMILDDDRIEDQKRTYPVIVMGTDKSMSGWGKAENGVSYAGWACRASDLEAVERWVRKRGDMSRVRVVGGDYHPPDKHGHCHIYVVEDGHPALG